MENEKIKIIFEDEDILVVDKPAGIVVFLEGESRGEGRTLIDQLIEERPELKSAGKPPRYGAVHRLDKDTSGILLVAKNNKSLDFFQEQFKNREVEKKYLALTAGRIEMSEGKIETLIGREKKKGRKKQKVYLVFGPDSEGKRKAITQYRVLERFDKYTLVEAVPKTGRKHQIRCHLAYLGHPIAGDKLYGFKNQPCPDGLKRQFLHAGYLRIKMPDGSERKFISELPEDLKRIIEKLK